MNYLRRIQFPWRRLVVLVALATSLAGCSSKSADPATAKDCLVQTLDSWKAGESPNQLKSRSPSITVGDPDWESGSKLLTYEIMGEETSDGRNMHLQAHLTLQSPQGEAVQQTVSFVVGTHPVITIFREDL